ncbi:MAG: hypothetical protein K2P58_14195 [Hyphomonadaceae bacterium]|nr:hypothetical protein [Hyphomonadaceae bacterium]
MRVAVLVLSLALTLAACNRSEEKAEAPPPEDANAISLSIEIGRYGVMLSQVHALTGEMPAASAETDASDPKDMARRLRETVWEYNLERSSLCGRGLYTTLACAPAYEPPWLGEPASAEVSIEDLQIRSVAVGEEVMRFWNAVCADARGREPDEDQRRYVCAME